MAPLWRVLEVLRLLLDFVHVLVLLHWVDFSPFL